ncbi:hypothetical protein SAMN04488029_4008 [Reichenbachiella faecimaris]|uniref:Phosphate-selective porin O and P n=1 Tax=Reichenbachiella faecimaris TaxID=692418 RepID=A0A1W2GQS3_REIFA|nr:hypothetical protein [Reichenbachiella faecimaris]SMD39025.1 hypothetical protein SAMN04488029_4008 [Reichenbachiella faecimaris]
MKNTSSLSWFFTIQRAIVLAVLVFAVGRASAQSEEVYTEFSGNLGFEYRYFTQDGLYPGQNDHFPAFSIQPEYYVEWQGGTHILNFTGFARVDLTDSERNHLDIRELYWQIVNNNWEFSVGLKKIYWGVTEAAHLVDIINQTDNLESFDGEQKLGQFMAHYSYNTNIGTFDLFAMSFFRKRQFPGVDGRLRTPDPITENQLDFESSMDETRPEGAIRWSHYFGPVDIGLSYFYGNGREPIVGINNDGSLFGIYPVIKQTGIDIQTTTGPVLWKFESIIRRSDIQDMKALDVGLEYTFGNIGGSGIDLGLLGEYLYDDRGDRALSSLQSDAFVGGRLAFNDVQSTEFLFGTILDVNRSTRLISLEGNRRFGESLKASVEMRLFQNVSEEEFIYLFRDDDFLKFELGWYF